MAVLRSGCRATTAAMAAVAGRDLDPILPSHPLAGYPRSSADPRACGMSDSSSFYAQRWRLCDKLREQVRDSLKPRRAPAAIQHLAGHWCGSTPGMRAVPP